MGAPDIAQTLHFLEFGLKINGEVWVKVMDENMVPNRAALIEPELKFLLLLDNAPAHLQAGL